MPRMKKLITFCLSLIPSLSWAALEFPKEKYEIQEAVRQAQVAVKNSPLIPMAAYGAAAVFVFVALVILVFIIIMFFKR